MVQLVNCAEDGWVHYGQIIEDIKLLYKDMRNWGIIYCPRVANNAVQLLAKFSFSVLRELAWLEDFLSCIFSCIQREKLCSD